MTLLGGAALFVLGVVVSTVIELLLQRRRLTSPLSQKNYPLGTSHALNTIPHMIECGRHSGFPECCMFFFVTEWLLMSNVDRKRYSAAKERANAGKHVEYVACPGCVKARRFVEVKRCPSDAHDWYDISQENAS